MPIQPPRPKPVPMNALRAFEAAARLGGFARAADELCVTPGAVAQHVRLLEDWADVALFERHAQGVTLTDAGRRVLPHARAAFDQMGETAQALRAEAENGALHLAALPAIAQLWITPRLPDLRQAYPDLQVSVTALEQPPNLRRDPYDAALFMADAGSTVVARDILVPVAAPAIAARVESVEDLTRVPCLQDSAWQMDWPRWLAGAGVPNLQISGPVHSLYALAVQDAMAGGGVLMGHKALLKRHLQRGELVPISPVQIASGRDLRLFLPDNPRRDRRIAGALDRLGV